MAGGRCCLLLRKGLRCTHPNNKALVFFSVDARTYVAEDVPGKAHNSKCPTGAMQQGFGGGGMFGWPKGVLALELEEALDQLDRGVLQVNPATYVWLLRQCGSPQALANGRRLHDHTVRSVLDRETMVGNTLVQMYGKCGSLDEARSAFEAIGERNVFSWSIMIGLYAQHKRAQEALELFERMDVKPNEVTFINVLGACSSRAALAQGRKIHSRIVVDSFDSEVSVGNALVNMYSNCGSLEDARNAFNKMPAKNVISWNGMIAAYAQHGHSREAVDLFYEMEPHGGVKPDRISFLSVLSACSSLGDLTEGIAIHSRFSASKLKPDVSVGNTLINMYAKCGSLDGGKCVFDGMHRKNVISWTAMISAYAQHGHFEEALGLYRRMAPEAVKPNEITFITVLGACAEAGDLAEAKEIHAEILASELSELSVIVGNSLINAYAKCGSLEDAKNVFESMRWKNVVSWTAMVAAYAQCGHPHDALVAFQLMDLEGVEPNGITFCTINAACSDLGALKEGKVIHERIIANGYDSDVVVCNSLINLYSKCRLLHAARAVFEQMQGRNVISWSAMIGAYADVQEQAKEALLLFRQMDLEGVIPSAVTFVSVLDACSTSTTELHLQEGKAIHACTVDTELESNVFVGTATVNLYAKCGSLDDAQAAFERIDPKDLMAWTAMIAAYAQHGYGKEALKLYQRMGLEGMAPDEITFINLMFACSRIGAKAEGRLIHAHIVENGFESDALGNSLVSFYGVCGTLHQVRSVFNSLRMRDASAWNAIIAVYGQHGHYEESVLLFQQMNLEGVKANEITFTTLLFSCSHAGVVDEALSCFHFMAGDHNVLPTMEHYGCMVDLLGRSGWLNKAEELVNSMPIQAGAVTWMTLLSGCKVHGQLDIGKRAAEHVMSLDPRKSAPYVMLSNMYRMPDGNDQVHDRRTCRQIRNCLDNQELHALVEQPQDSNTQCAPGFTKSTLEGK